MSATATRPDTSYLLRKLHSLPASFLLAHFSQSISGRTARHWSARAQYDETSQTLQTIPFRIFVEWAFIFLPMLYHGGYGIYIWLHGQVECFGISVGEELAVIRCSGTRD